MRDEREGEGEIVSDKGRQKERERKEEKGRKRERKEEKGRERERAPVSGPL